MERVAGGTVGTHTQVGSGIPAPTTIDRHHRQLNINKGDYGDACARAMDGHHEPINRPPAAAALNDNSLLLTYPPPKPIFTRERANSLTRTRLHTYHRRRSVGIRRD